MTVAQSKLTAQGQISVPAEVRRRLGLGPGSVLEWRTEDGRIVVRKAGKYGNRDLHEAAFPQAPAPRTLAELREGPAKYARARHARR
jgi:AbrB family looped-hinge helix DNA binding protein